MAIFRFDLLEQHSSRKYRRTLNPITPYSNSSNEILTLSSQAHSLRINLEVCFWRRFARSPWRTKEPNFCFQWDARQMRGKYSRFEKEFPILKPLADHKRLLPEWKRPNNAPRFLLCNFISFKVLPTFKLELIYLQSLLFCPKGLLTLTLLSSLV